MDMIVKNCRDTEMHPVLGLTYRVKIRSLFSSTVETTVREEFVWGKSNPQKALKDDGGSAGRDSSDAGARSLSFSVCGTSSCHLYTFQV